MLALAVQNASALHKVIIDPGHGGVDHGAVYYNLRESDITLQISQLLQKQLIEAGSEVIMTRNNDRHVSLAERAELARQNKGDIFLSIHLNSSEDSRASGMEIYFENQLPADEESMFLANKENADHYVTKEIEWPLKPIPQAQHLKGDLLYIVQDLQRNHRIQMSSILALKIAQKWQGNRRSTENTIHQAPFYVISNVNMPSTLIEVGFVSNQKEAELLKSPSYQQSIVRGIVQGIKTYQEMIDKTSDLNLM